MNIPSFPPRLDYILQPEAQRMLGHFSSLHRVRIGFFSLDAKEICVGLNRPSCEYCRLLRTDKKMNGKCSSLDRTMFEKARKQNRPLCYTCHGQLTEAVLPVMLGGRGIGFIMVGQFRTLGKNTMPAFSTWNPPKKGLTRKLRLYYEKTPAFSKQQVEDMLHMLHLMVDYITGHYLVSMKDFDLIHPLMERIQSNPSETISIKEAAESIGRSPSGLFQLFKKLTGQGLRQFQTESKLKEADRLLKTFPQMPIKEIAARIGFNDPLYFSRLYRKHRGTAPTTARR